VREHAELKVFGNIGALKALKDEKPGLIIAVGGCMMQQQAVADRLYKRFPFVDMVFGTHNMHRFPEMLKRVLEQERVFELVQGDTTPEGLPITRKKGVSASVTIMYGCDNYCTYCIVPYVRGHERSRSMDNIEHEARDAVARGYSEIMLLGQNVNSFKAEGYDYAFAALLRRLDAIDGLRRIRFMTSHPKDVSDELITVISECKKVCHHIHLPVQSGSNGILKSMNRRYTREHYIALVNKVRACIPDIEFTTDIIVGFPGETEDDFNDTLALMDKVGFAAAFTFMYSPRSGTAAAKMEGQIPLDIKKARLRRLNELQARKTRENNEKYIGKRLEVLVEGCDMRETSMAFGKSGNFKMVYFPGTPDMIGSYAPVFVKKTKRNSLMGELIQEEK
jgi:tRNA-2-methylthio-N6-dimethylallyladenosine synthase